MTEHTGLTGGSAQALVNGPLTHPSSERELNRRGIHTNMHSGTSVPACARSGEELDRLKREGVSVYSGKGRRTKWALMARPSQVCRLCVD